ncbi:MAG TPA: hypothetical protein VN947_07790 [Polyangia bacterium]|nr:hypothetical protein [Polyangia bacterium]
MKTKKIRRSLLWAVLVAGFAGTLTMGTHPVRAESISSSEIATGDGTTVQPYVWAEVADSVTGALTSVAHVFFSCMFVQNAVLVAAPAYRALPERALD